MTSSTRDQFLQAAIKQFADRGFYGTSIASIAADLGLTKQALLRACAGVDRGDRINR